MPIGKLGRGIVAKDAGIMARRIRMLESQHREVPPRFTIAGGYLVDDCSAGDYSVNINTFPEWARGIGIYIVIDAGTLQAEMRKVTSLDNTVAHFGIPLKFAHLVKSPVIFTAEPEINPRWFGAIGDDTADDKSAFQAASSNLRELGGGTIKVPGATFRLSGGINIHGSSLIGSGMYSSILHFTQSSGADCVGSYSGVVVDPDLPPAYDDEYSGVVVSDISVIADSGGSGGAGRGVYIKSCPNAAVRRVRVDRCDIGIAVIDCMYAIVTECVVGRCTTANYKVDSQMSNTTECISLEAPGQGITIASSAISSMCSNNVVDNALAEGIVTEAPNSVVYGNSVFGCGSGGIVASVDATAINGNVIRSCSGYGMYVYGGNTAAITGNVVVDNISGGITSSATKINFGDNIIQEDGFESTGSIAKRNDINVEYLPAKVWTSMTGSPSIVGVGVANNSCPAWKFDLGNRRIGCWWRVPHSLVGQSFTTRLIVYWSPMSGGSGHVVLSSGITTVSGAADPPKSYSPSTSSAMISSVTPGQLYVTRVQTTTSNGYRYLPYKVGVSTKYETRGGQLLRIYIGRDSGSGDDTYDKGIYIFGAELWFES